ncbi:hypothetical protein HRI_004075000 [Hibiscus trionum]|uniref:Integrase zinc-binding domain-containing protein n=1 Tax=Hibiscus trionum TaxID=183268 RepID=A0A9W7MH38_HIBTR|nr:hypothetical protein HRI_004075000 [Hibiscus trionum]
MAAGYFLDKQILYKKGATKRCSKCVENHETKKIIDEVHEGICRIHANGLSMSRQIMRLGYYRVSMVEDCVNFAQRCHKCQIYGDKIHMASSPLHVITAL